MRWTVTRVVAPVAALALLLAGCGDQDEPSAGPAAEAGESTPDAGSEPASTDPGSTEPAPEGSTATQPGESVPGTGEVADLDFGGTTIDGEPFEGASLAGRPAVLWFWAPWCPTCRAQSDNVSELAEKYDGEVAVVGVGGLDTAEAIDDLATEIPHVTHLVDDEGEVWRHFRVTEQSTYTVIGADGEIKSEGYLDDAELNDLVARLAPSS